MGTTTKQKLRQMERKWRWRTWFWFASASAGHSEKPWQSTQTLQESAKISIAVLLNFEFSVSFQFSLAWHLQFEELSHILSLQQNFCRMESYVNKTVDFRLRLMDLGSTQIPKGWYWEDRRVHLPPLHKTLHLEACAVSQTHRKAAHHLLQSTNLKVKFRSEKNDLRYHMSR